MENKLKKIGFLHLKNVIKQETINRIKDYIKNINFKEKLYYNIYNVKTNTIKNLVSSQLKEFMDGHNNFVKNTNRQVFQLWQYETNGLNPYEKSLFIPNKYRNNIDGGYILTKKTSTILHNYYTKNKLFFDNSLINDLISGIKLLKNTFITSIKLFYNYPNCCEQEIHVDDLEDGIIYITIPINFHENSGNTVVYNNEYVNKYKKNITKNLMNYGYINNFSEEKKQDFLKAENKESINVGDVLVFNGYTFHKGETNSSSYPRIFIHLRFKKNLILDFNTHMSIYRY